MRPDRFWRLISDIRSTSYDLAIDCSSGSSLLSGAFATLSGAHYRLAPSGRSQSHLFNVHGVLPESPIHVIDETLALLQQAGIRARTRDMMIRVADIDRQWALSRLCDNAPPGAHIRVGVNIGGAGTLVASLASLITFREYTKHVKGQTGRFMVLFSAISFGFLGVLLVAMTLWMR